MEGTKNKGSRIELHARRNQPRLSILIPSSCIEMANSPDSGEAYETLESHPGPIPPFNTKYITETAQISEGSSISDSDEDQYASREHSTVSGGPEKQRHYRASLGEWHTAQHELLSTRLSCETGEDSDPEKTPTKKTDRGKPRSRQIAKAKKNRI